MSEIRILETKVLENTKVLMKEYVDEEYGCFFRKIILPHLTDDELLERYKRIKPIALYDDIYYFLKRYNSMNKMRNECYLWDLKKYIRDEVNMTGAKELAEFPCYHEYGDKQTFKPSIADVLQQFPDELVEEANAFYINSFVGQFPNLKLQSAEINDGHYISMVKALVLKK